MTKENPRWDRFTKWLQPNDPDLEKWKKWKESKNVECEIRTSGAEAALFCYQNWAENVSDIERNKKLWA